MIDHIETDRMVGYRMAPSHFDDLNMLHKDEKVALTMNGTWTDRFVKDRLQTYLDHWDQHGFGLCMFYSRDVGEFVGRGGLVAKEIDGVEEVEVGFAVMPEFWRQGYGEEMGRQCLEIGFKDLKLPSLVSFTLPSNTASQNLIQKLGFSYEKDIEAFELKQKLYRLKNPALV